MRFTYKTDFNRDDVTIIDRDKHFVPFVLSVIQFASRNEMQDYAQFVVDALNEKHERDNK